MGDKGVARTANGAARCVLAVRQMMRQAISADLVLNPAVDMLLALYLDDRRMLRWQEVCAATATLEETCRRWGKALEERGLVTIEDDGCRLTERGDHVMAEVNDRVWQIAADHLSPDLRPPA